MIELANKPDLRNNNKQAHQRIESWERYVSCGRRGGLIGCALSNSDVRVLERDSCEWMRMSRIGIWCVTSKLRSVLLVVESMYIHGQIQRRMGIEAVQYQDHG